MEYRTVILYYNVNNERFYHTSNTVLVLKAYSLGYIVRLNGSNVSEVGRIKTLQIAIHLNLLFIKLKFSWQELTDYAKIQIILHPIIMHKTKHWIIISIWQLVKRPTCHGKFSQSNITKKSSSYAVCCKLYGGSDMKKLLVNDSATSNKMGKSCNIAE